MTERPIVEIECSKCHKKVMRCKGAKKCFNCTGTYKPRENSVEMKCAVCKMVFKSFREKTNLCSKICMDIHKNRKLNDHWIAHEIKPQPMSHPWKGSPCL